jgi:hypothetical protein
MLSSASHPETRPDKEDALAPSPILAIVLIGASALATLVWVAMGIWWISAKF